MAAVSERRQARVGLIACGLALAILAASAIAPERGSAATTRYSLVKGCYGLRSVESGKLVATESGPFRMQATELGQYLFYGRNRDFLAADANGDVGPAAEPSPMADWRVDPAGSGAFKVFLPAAGSYLAVSAGAPALAGPAAAGRFRFVKAQGCPRYPEVAVNVKGGPYRGPSPYGEVGGFFDPHAHFMNQDWLGGKAHCGRNWHRYGAPYALVDCEDHEVGNGCAAVLENVLYGDPARCHDPVGWPTFKDWPHPHSLTHEQTYYRWVERTWRSGMRVITNLFVENQVLCEVYPYGDRSCNEMDSVRLQLRQIHQLEDYIDAQSGGPGKGFFRIVKNPFQARRVMNGGKLAIVPGIEVSTLFDCGVYNDIPTCDKADIRREVNYFYRRGVRQLELLNKFDNAFVGVAFDGGPIGIAINAANKRMTGRFWQAETCPGPATDNQQITPAGEDEQADIIANGLIALLPPGTLPLYPPPPHCNTRGLTQLGEYLVRLMMRKGMILDVDHMSVLARKQTMALVESQRYSGVISSHSWADPPTMPRIYSVGGVVAPMAGDSTGYVEAWKQIRPRRSRRYYYGFGFGDDMNGYASQGGPRNGANPVRYPFRSVDGGSVISRQRSGQRVFDFNEDGVAHYGMFADWVEDVRHVGGQKIIRDIWHGAEAYLQMWERAVGVPRPRCRAAHSRFGSAGLVKVRLGDRPVKALFRSGQPQRRVDRVYRWCVRGRGNRRAKVVAVFTPGERIGLIGSTASDHRAGEVRRGDRVADLRGIARPFGPGVFVAPPRGPGRIVYGVRGGRVSFIALASRSVARSPGGLRGYLRLAGLR